jgi:Mrp family chromosome partitioning ATPase
MIYTFYSYQDGVGRSMALANVAECFALHGLRVLVVDWNLKAPGLESFFFQPAEGHRVAGSEPDISPVRDVVTIQSRVGLIDMLNDYRRSFAEMWPPADEMPEPEAALDDRIPPLSHYLVSIHSEDRESPSGDGGSLSLLPAGRRAEEYQPAYGEAVRDFDWDDFLASYRGIDFFGSLRASLLQTADVVLIDAPTAAGDLGGVCTRLLADIVVSFCAPALQALDCLAPMVERLRSTESIDARDHRPLEMVAVTARADDSAPEEVTEPEQRVAGSTEKSPSWEALQEQGLRLLDLQIPSRGKLSFRDRVVVRREGGGVDAVDPLEATYWKLASHLSSFAPEGHAIRRAFTPLDASPETPLPSPDPVAAPPTDAQPNEHPPEALFNEHLPAAPTNEHPAEALFNEHPPEALFNEHLPAAPTNEHPPEALSSEPQEEPKAAPLEVAPIDASADTPPATDEAIPVAAAADAGDILHSEPDRVIDDTIERPHHAPEPPPTPALAPVREALGSPVAQPRTEPSVPPVAATKAATPKAAGRRPAPTWGWAAAGLSLAVVGILVYFGSHRSDGARTASDPLQQPMAVATVETRPQSPVVPPASGRVEPPAAQQANGAPVDFASAKPLPGGAPPREQPSADRYLRVGFGPSCPRMLNYRRQFLAAGIADAKVVALKTGLCALVLGPYAADIAERRRKEHNDRHIRGFDTAMVVDDHEFDKWL